MTAARLVAGLGDPPGHVVEGLHQEAELVLAGHRQALAIVALRHGAGTFGQVGDGRHQSPRRMEGGPDRGQQAEHEHQGQGQGVAVLEGLAQVGQLLVTGKLVLHRLGQIAQALGDTVQRLQHVALLVGPADAQGHHGTHIDDIVDGVQAHIGLPGIQRHMQLRGRVERQNRGGIDAAAGDDAPIATGHGQFHGATAYPQVIQAHGDQRRLLAAQFHGQPLGDAQLFPQARVQRRTTQLQGALQGMFDAHIEPAVQATVQKLQGKVIDDADRRHRQHHEHHHQAPGEPHPRRTPS